MEADAAAPGSQEKKPPRTACVPDDEKSVPLVDEVRSVPPPAATVAKFESGVERTRVPYPFFVKELSPEPEIVPDTFAMMPPLPVPAMKALPARVSVPFSVGRYRGEPMNWTLPKSRPRNVSPPKLTLGRPDPVK